MKKHGNHSQLKEQENFPERKNNEINLSGLLHVQKAGNNNAEGIQKAIDRNADHCNKELQTMRSQPKLDNSIAKMKTKLNAINSRK